MRPDQQRVQTLLTDTVTLLCKNGLQYNKELKVQGLLGITLDDDDVFVVHINKIFDDVRGKMTSIAAEPIPSNAEEYQTMETTEGYEMYRETKEEQDTSQFTGMQLPLFHSSQTTTTTTTATPSSVGVAKKHTSNARKRPVGAAKRKEKRSVKQRLASSFSDDYSEYQGIRVSDEPPDKLIINPEDGEIRISDVQSSINMINGDIHTSSYSNSRDSFQAPKTEPVYENYSSGSRDSFSTNIKPESNAYDNTTTTNDNNTIDNPEDDQMDMIECLLYNEGKQSNTGVYQNVHISGGEDSPGEQHAGEMADYDRDCEENQEAKVLIHNPRVKESMLGSTKASVSRSSPVLDPQNRSDHVTWASLGQELSVKYKRHLDACRQVGDGYTCLECDQILKSRKTWMSHMKGQHMNVSLTCNVCGDQFKWKASLTKHQRMKHDCHMFGQPIDSKAVTVRKLMGEDLTSSPDVQKQEILTGSENAHQSKLPSTRPSFQLKFSAEPFQEFIKAPAESGTPLRLKQQTKGSAHKENLAAFRCKKCVFVSRSHRELMNHIRQKHRQKFSCSLCPAQFSSKSTKYRHTKRVHLTTPLMAERSALNLPGDSNSSPATHQVAETSSPSIPQVESVDSGLHDLLVDSPIDLTLNEPGKSL